MSSTQSDEEDLTRKQRREQARANRKQLEEAEATKAVRRTRLTQLGIVLVLVIVAIVGILVASGGGGKKPPPAHTKAANETISQVSALIGGIPQSGNVLGDPKAPVTLVYFGDLECPVCKDFTLGALQPLIQNWVRPGKLKVEYRSFETATREPEVFHDQQIAALAAGKQGKMWQYIETFYHEQGEENTGYVTPQFLQELAQQVPGLNVAVWTTDRTNPAFASQVAGDAQLATSQGFTGTPSFLIGKSGGAARKYEYTSLTDPSGFNQAIEAALKA